MGELQIEGYYFIFNLQEKIDVMYFSKGWDYRRMLQEKEFNDIV